MKIFIDIGHPAHVHYFRNFIKIMESKGHEFFVTARDRKYVFELLDAYHIRFVNRGKGGGSFAGRLAYLVKTSFRILRYALRFKPDLFIDFGTMYSCLASALTGKRYIVFEDTEITDMYRSVYKPVVSEIFTPECFELDLGKKHKRFKGYMELAYLHEKYFTPDSAVLEEVGIKSKETFSIVRFVDWKAVHDIGTSGLTTKDKVALIKTLEKYGRVFVSSEMPLPGELEKYTLRSGPEKLHSLMHFSSLVIGESATMASEAAMLGTPSVYVDSYGRGYTRDLENRYGILFNYTPEDVGKVFRKAEAILSDKNSKAQALAVREKIMSASADLTGLMVHIAEQ
jgi:predicted glycosyltransferase